MEKLKYLDVSLSYKVFKSYPRGANWHLLLSTLEWSCHGIPWLIGVIISIYIWPHSKLLASLLAGLILDLIIVAFTKATTTRARPLYANQNDQLIVASVDKHSMPSGHASRAMYVALLFSNSSFWSTLIWIWAIAVGLSRIFMGRHHILDVVAGYFCAFLLFNLQFGFGGVLNKIVIWILLHQFRDANDLSEARDLSPVAG